MPDIIARYDEDTDRNDRQRKQGGAQEAVKVLACAYADYARDVRAWLDLNLESRRPDGISGSDDRGDPPTAGTRS